MEPTEHDIAGMFDVISGRYDLLNHILSGYTDVRWRKKAIGMSLDIGVKNILDVSTGTGDMAIGYKKAGRGVHVYGLDISMEMLKLAKIKGRIENSGIHIIRGSGLSLPFKDNMFDLISCAFGIRNIYPREGALKEFYRVAKPGGVLLILEFSMPKGIAGRTYKIYFERILPVIGNILTRTSAYTYLRNSVEAFPEQEVFGTMLNSTGFEDVMIVPLTFGVAAMYKGKKRL